MKHLFLVFGLITSPFTLANEPFITVPWEEFDVLYRNQIKENLEQSETDKTTVISLERVKYDLQVDDYQATGVVSIWGNAISGNLKPIDLFGQGVVVTGVTESNNVSILADESGYKLLASSADEFSTMFEVSIPVLDSQVNPRIELDVPTGVSNEISLVSKGSLEPVQSNTLHEVGDKYYFAPTKSLYIGFERSNQNLEDNQDEGQILAKIKTPDEVLDAVTFLISFAEDGSVLSEIHLNIPDKENNQLELNPIEGAEIWSLHVNDISRSVYDSNDGKWLIPLDPKVDSKVVLSYLTKGEKLGLEGRLDFDIPQTSLTAQKINLVIGLPERMHLLAMDSDLKPAKGLNWPEFANFHGKRHFFSKPFYRGHSLNGSIIYQEPVNP